MSDYDATYRDHEHYFGAEPDSVLRRHLNDLKPEGRVLDIGVGQGRNALALAKAGMDVAGVDSSAEAVSQALAAAEASGLELDLWQGDFLDYEPDDPFDTVLCFGLMQILSRAECASLVHRLHVWTLPGSLLLLTAWHVDDPSYERIRDSWEPAGLHSFVSPEGEYRTYLPRGAIRNLVRGWEILHFEEKMGPPHDHGDGEEHSHGVVELVARRR